MIILTTGASQSIKFIPRKYVSSVLLFLTNKTTNTTTEYSNPVVSNSDTYMTLTVGGLDLKEGTTYSMIVYNPSEGVIYKDMIFCTDQAVSDYSINKNVYTEHQSTNEYIFYNE